MKSLGLIIFLLSFFGALKAQNSFNSELVVGGLTSQIDGDNYGGFNKFGYHAGFYTTRKFKQSDLEWQLGIQWAAKGSFKPSEPDKGIYNTYKIKLNYAQVPFGIRKEFKKIWLDGGLTAGYLVSSQEEDQNGIVSPNTLDYTKIELAYYAGIKYWINDKVAFSIWQSRSILPMADALEITTFGLFGGSFNNVIYFNLHYRFLKNS